MTNRLRKGILCLCVLTFLPISPRTAFAEEGIADGVKKSVRIKKKKKEPIAKIDLGRDLANKLVRPGSMAFKSHRLAQAEKIDYFLVYFGAHWCPNSKKFTPKLTEFYGKHRSAHRNFEIIFVSADKDEDAMLHYMNGYKMPWPAVKFGEHKKIKSLVKIAGRGYPCVALVDAKAGKVIAHSYGETGKGDYVGPEKPVAALKAILEKKDPQPIIKSAAYRSR